MAGRGWRFCCSLNKSSQYSKLFASCEQCAGVECREAYGVRGACSRFWTAVGRATAPASWTHSQTICAEGRSAAPGSLPLRGLTGIPLLVAIPLRRVHRCLGRTSPAARARDSLDDAGCGHKAERSRHKAGRAKAGVAVNPQVLLLTGRGTDQAVRPRIYSRFP